MALASLYWLIQNVGSFPWIWGGGAERGGKKEEGMLNQAPGLPPKPGATPQRGLTFATKRSTSILEVSLAARGPHW